MSLTTLALLILGFVFLMEGTEWLVRGAARLAAASGIPPLLIGLTVVALSTSAPELTVSLQAAFNGQPDIALGNVIGSNILNILFILGLSAVLIPLAVPTRLIRREVPWMIAASSLAYFLALDGQLNKLDGWILFVGLWAYFMYSILQGCQENVEVQNEYIDGYSLASREVLKNLGLLGVGLTLLVLGAHWLVTGAVEAARFFGVSELITGLTLIAAGTSMPEIAAAAVAILRGEQEVAVGTVVGSNLFNILAVLGFTSLAAPTGLPVSPAVLGFDLPIMLVAAVACLPLFFTDHLLARWEGALFLVYYMAYTAYLILCPLQHDSLEIHNSTMLYFVIPLTAITLLVLALRALRKL